MMTQQSMASAATISITHPGEELFQSYRGLVFDTYEKRGWANQNDCPDRMLVDSFESVSRSFVIHEKGRVISGMRLVHDSMKKFPHENLLGYESLMKEGMFLEQYQLIKDTPREQVAEITMVAGLARMQTMVFNLAKGLYWYGQVFNVKYYLMVIDFDFFRLCNHVGIPIHPYGRPFLLDSCWTMPSITIPSEYPPHFSESVGGKNFLLSKDNLDSSWSNYIKEGALV